MQEILNWVISNKLALVEGYLALIGLVSIIIKITPTVKDDMWLKKYLKFTGKFIALNK